MKKISGLLFDMDGTLIDSSRDIENSLNFTLEAMGYSRVSTRQVRNFIGDGMKTLLLRATGKADDDLVKNAVKIFRPHYLEHCIDFTQTYPGVHETLHFFQEKPLALVSNKPVEMVWKILKHLKLDNYFRTVLGAESTQEKKPHPAPILETIKRLQLVPESSLMIGDGTTDIRAGKSAGAWTCAVTYGFKNRSTLEAYRPDFFIDKIDDLKRMFS